MSSTRPPASPPVINGYTYQSLLGTGGYADVFLYEQQRPRRPVAIKVLLAAGLTDARRQQFTAEADLMARASAHPYIVNIFDTDVANDGRPYLVMEYYPRPHLGARARTERLSVPEVLRMGIQIAGAVESAHRLGILHRDIKPANILTNAYGSPGLTDFGISATLGAPVDEDDDGGGMSIPWSGPEVFRPDTEFDERCDVYSLGATCWHLLVGHSPFEDVGGDNRPLAMMRRIETERVPETGRDDVPAALARALARAMQKKRAGRFESAFDFARALQSIQQELQLSVTPIEVPAAQSEQARPPRDASDVDATRLKPRRVDPHRPSAPQPRTLTGARSTRGATPVYNDHAIAGRTDQERPLSDPAQIAVAPPRRRAAVVAGVVLVVVAVGIAMLVATTSSRRGVTADAPAPKPVAQDVHPDSFVPPVEASSSKVLPDSVRFAWLATDPEPGDFFLVRRTDAGPGQRVNDIKQQAASIELTGTGGHGACIAVLSVRSGGQTSAPTTLCAGQ